MIDQIQTYEIGQNNSSFKCLVCDTLSLHPSDIANRHCLKCCIYHDDFREYIKKYKDEIIVRVHESKRNWKNIPLSQLDLEACHRTIFTWIRCGHQIPYRIVRGNELYQRELEKNRAEPEK